MSEEFGSDFISITDDEGKNYELEILASVEYNGATYFALAPADPDEEEEAEVCVLKQICENGEDILVTVDDDAEWDAVNEKIMELLYEEDTDEASEVE